MAACSDTSRERAAAPPARNGQLFTLLPSSYTGVTFANRLTETREFNVFTYRNFYNGGGVAIGDLSGDSLPEIVLTSNEGGPRLYLNLGHFRFRDITQAAGIEEHGRWTTGVTLADVNGDGRLDIYVCHAGLKSGAARANTLYINQGLKDGIPFFREMAAAYGIADTGYSTQAAFFDYDGDGDLDLFLIRNSPKAVATIPLRNMRTTLQHNNGDGTFSDVAWQGGVARTDWSWGALIVDLDLDGNKDIFVANGLARDVTSQDYIAFLASDQTVLAATRGE